MAEELDDPKANKGEGGGAGERSANQADGIIAVKEKRPQPALPEFPRVRHPRLCYFCNVRM